MIKESIYDTFSAGTKSRICQKCKSPFFVYNEKDWVYRDGDRFFCSWHCLRSWEAQKGERRTVRIRVSDEMAAKTMKMHRDGVPVKEIADKVGISITSVRTVIKKAESKEQEKNDSRKTFTLRDVLKLIVDSEELPDCWRDFSNIRPNGGNDIRLRFMSESETSIETYSRHPFLIPWYECEVDSIQPMGDLLEIWLDYEPFVREMVGLEPRTESKEDQDAEETAN